MTKRRSERAAVTSIVAVLLAGGVILGMTALAVDVGGMMVERRQLQNGAEAAALSLAQSCADGTAACAPGNATRAALTDDNAKDALHAIDLECGTNVGGVLPGCPPASLDLVECPPLPPSLSSIAGLPYVEVHTSSQSSEGGFIRNVFSGAGGGTDTTTVRSCARAAWGTPGPFTATTPVTFSVCEFQAMIAKSLSVYDPPVGDNPGYDSDPSTEAPSWPTSAHEQAVILQATSGSKEPIPGCTTFNGHDTAGGFGYLTGDGCSAEITSDSWVQGETGNNAKDCDISVFWKKVIQIPVFDCMKQGSSPKPSGAPSGTCDEYEGDAGTGAKNWYHIVGWANFYVSGYQTGGLGSSAERSVLTNKICKDFTTGKGKSDRCLIGWFVSGTLADAPIVAPPGATGIDLGTYALALAG